MKHIDEIFKEGIRTAAITGHVRPDGDCAGAVTGLYRYLRKNRPELELAVFLEEIPENLRFLLHGIPVRNDAGKPGFDLAISLDTSEPGRIGAGKEAFLGAAHTVCIDHHETHPGFAGINHIEPRTSSVSEILVKLLDADKIDTECAAAFYTGIVHDTGVFRYDSVTGDTLRTAAVLVDKGIPFSEIIEHSISNLSYREMLIASEVILGSHFYEEEKLLTGFAPLSLQQKIGISPLEFGSVVTELNQMDRAETVLFLYETEPGVYKGSLRSKGPVSVSGIAALFGGGGHERAAGFSLAEPPEVIIEKVRAAVSEARKS